jgi:hexosaminidase
LIYRKIRTEIGFAAGLSLLFFIGSCTVNDRVKSAIHVIPRPLHIRSGSGHFLVTPRTKIETNDENVGAHAVANYLAERIRVSTGYKEILLDTLQRIPSNGTILLELTGHDAKLGNEGYRICVTPERVTIRAAESRGLFYGVQTLMQLLPPEIFKEQASDSVRWTIPCVKITDRPRYPYRGMHLDVSRHFFSKSFIKKYIDCIAMHKMNTFHWHLVDDQGWRIEIKKYPLLTKVGGWRVDREHLNWNARPVQRPDEKAAYGGFYTQKDIREIVAYAQSRYVTILPEIEMPAHVTSALAAYPEYSCTGGPFSVPPGGVWPITDIYCAGNDSTFAFLEDVLMEIMDLFPCEYIHIGGDEADKTEWMKCPKCQARIRKEGLQDEYELQSYFIRRIETFLHSKGKKLIGWDEILEGGLAPEATVMSWRGMKGGIEAARQGHDVIMTPTSHCYFDYYQADPDFEPPAIGGFTPLRHVYSFDPAPDVLTRTEAKHILGAQGNVWTEYISTPEHAEYMSIPRMCALAEVVWSHPNLRNWTDFRNRLNIHLRRLDFLNVHYSRGSYRVDFIPEWDAEKKRFSVRLESEQADPVIRYTLEESGLTKENAAYTEPIVLDTTTTIRAGIFENGKLIEKVSVKTVAVHRGIGGKIRYRTPFSSRYPAGGEIALVDGMKGTLGHGDGYWQGFEGDDADIVVDLGKPVPLTRITADFLQNLQVWIFQPVSVEFSISRDGKIFESAVDLNNINSDKKEGAFIQTWSHEYSGVQARYIRLLAENRGICPGWHPGSGEKAWIFIDEIVIE